MRGQSLRRDQRQPRGDHPSPPYVVDDVDAVVLPVRPGDTEKERQPPPEAEATFFGEAALENQLVPQAPKITTFLLRDAVEEDLKVRPHTSRKLHPRSFAHPP